ncbi:MAG TPA: hypothetical protein VGV90_02875 [Solirubrobacteraceae bacterium]|nr:hypothetical protein [Solirubrobacteraceae bacterium]
MEDAFGTIVWVVAIVGAIVAVFTLVGSGRSYREIGGGGLVRDHDDDDVRGAGTGDTAAERDEEIRQMLGARNARRERRGEAPLDVDAEMAALDRPPPDAVDSGLREEIRAHVVARNARRVRAGQDPLDVDEEIERRIRDLT